MHLGTIVDVTLIAAPSSNKNKERKPVVFGMKVHTGVDKDSGLIRQSLSRLPTCATSRQLPICCMTMSRSSTATLASRASPKGPRWTQ